MVCSQRRPGLRAESAFRTAMLTAALQGDGHMLAESRKWARHNFDQGRKLGQGSVEAEQGVKHAAATAQILRENVVQGKRESGESHNYSTHRQIARSGTVPHVRERREPPWL